MLNSIHSKNMIIDGLRQIVKRMQMNADNSFLPIRLFRGCFKMEMVDWNMHDYSRTK